MIKPLDSLAMQLNEAPILATRALKMLPVGVQVTTLHLLSPEKTISQGCQCYTMELILGTLDVTIRNTNFEDVTFLDELPSVA
jgi:hypothetical protein